MLPITDNSYLNYLIWRCPLCFSKANLTSSTPIIGITLKEFDLALRLWVKTQASGSAASLITRTEQTGEYFKIFRNSLAYYFRTRVKPYIQIGYDSIVEIDESKASNVRGFAGIYHPQYKWLFGLFCRRTKIIIIYYIKNWRKQQLYPYLKKHLRPGSFVITDEHKSYVNQAASRSHLTELGYFHFWVNHASYRYCHEDFPFVYTNGIERTWGLFKRVCKGLGHHSSPIILERYGDSFSSRQLINPKYLYLFTLKCLRRYYGETV